MAKSRLESFLNPVEVEETKEIVISSRFVEEDKDGNTVPVPFTIKAIMQDENDELIKSSTKSTKVSGQVQEIFDKKEYQSRLVVACVTDPEFENEKICKRYGVVNPLEVPGKMLRAGEFNKLVANIMEFNGFKNPDELLEEAKNL